MARARAAPRGDREPRPRARAAPDRLPAATSARSGSTPRVLPRVLRASDSLGLAREDAWSPGETGEVPFVVRRDPLPCAAGDELGEDEIVRLFRARGEERQRVFAAADALRREVNGDEVTYVVTRNIQYTNVCYFRCGFCAFSKGKLAANLRGEPYLVPHEEIVRRRRRGVGARRDRGLPPGRDPPGVRRRLLRLGRPRDQGRRARAPRPRVQRARDLAGRRDARRAAARLPRAAARRGARLAAGHGRGGARRRGPRGHLPRQDHDRAVARGAPHRARARAALEQHDHVRPRRRAPRTGRATSSRCASCSARRAASPSSCRSRSCTWRRRSTSRAARGRGRPSARCC